MTATYEGKSKTGMTCKQLRELADSVFTKRTPLLNVWQEVAENFYPIRATFTVKRHLGDDLAGNLSTSYPILCQRDLSDQIQTMLRNTNKPWFNMATADFDRLDHESKAWLEWATGVQRRTMYARVTQFTKAAALADADFSAFGQAALTVRLNRHGNDLIYRCWHLRDMAWIEDENGMLCAFFRRWKPTCRDLMGMFDGKSGSSVHAKIARRAAKTPLDEVECYHFMVMADMYDGPANGKSNPSLQWRSVYYDCENQHPMEEVAQQNKEYIVPRWLTASGTQWAHSPATVAALPEARLLQAMTWTLLEAGEKVVSPPMAAVEQAIRSDIALYAGGITWIDMEYDEKTGAALRPIMSDSKGMPLAREMQQDSRAMLMQCFYLNKLALPQRGPDMTAYEVGQRVQQYIRDALPLFEPMEAEYNGALCEETFHCIRAAGGFGSPLDMPKKLRGAMVDFRYQSPLHDMIESQKGQKFLEMSQMLAQAAAMDKNSHAVVDTIEAFRDALAGTGTPTKWTRSETRVQELIDKAAAAEQTASLLAHMEQASNATANLAGAQKDMAQAAPAVA